MDKEQIKTNLINFIAEKFESLKVKQQIIAMEYNLTQNEVSKIINRRIEVFSIARLIEIITRLGYKVEVEIDEEDDS